jgi:hypothetical protein
MLFLVENYCKFLWTQNVLTTIFPFALQDQLRTHAITLFFSWGIKMMINLYNLRKITKFIESQKYSYSSFYDWFLTLNAHEQNKK